MRWVHGAAGSFVRRAFRGLALVGVSASAWACTAAGPVATAREDRPWRPAKVRLRSGNEVQVLAVDGRPLGRLENAVAPGPHVVVLRSRTRGGTVMQFRECEVTALLREGRVYEAGVVRNPACGEMSFGCARRLHALFDAGDPRRRWTCAPR